MAVGIDLIIDLILDCQVFETLIIDYSIDY